MSEGLSFHIRGGGFQDLPIHADHTSFMRVQYALPMEKLGVTANAGSM